MLLCALVWRLVEQPEDDKAKIFFLSGEYTWTQVNYFSRFRYHEYYDVWEEDLLLQNLKILEETIPVKGVVNSNVRMGFLAHFRYLHWKDW